MNGMRTGLVGLPMKDGRALIVWNKDKKIGWQFYDERGQMSGSVGSVDTLGSGVAVTTTKAGDVVLFRGSQGK